MKRILFLLSLLPTLLFAGGLDPVKPVSEPALVLELGSFSGKLLDDLSADADLCCVYEFCQSDSLESGVTLVRHKQTGFVLGVIYGVPNKSFLRMLSEQFTPAYIADVIRANSLTGLE
jgi:hypothetical protein